MNYSLILEYIDSILHAENNFATLTHLCPILDYESNPIMSNGNFDVVFKMRDESIFLFFIIHLFERTIYDNNRIT